jgi:hypothetical protein
MRQTQGVHPGLTRGYGDHEDLREEGDLRITIGVAM